MFPRLGATWSYVPHPGISRSLGALDTLIEMLQVQVLRSFGYPGRGLGRADPGVSSSNRSFRVSRE